ncbi:MAG: metalloregulator ArsR/SmtB family transcription factor [Oscillospiraceae bacterium]
MNKVLTCDCCVVHEEVVAAAKKSMLPIKELETISSIFKILGDLTRTKLVWTLDQREMCVCDLAVTLNMTKSAISHQLAALKQYKIVKSRRDGKNVFYSLDDEHITNIIELAREHTSHIEL